MPGSYFHPRERAGKSKEREGGEECRQRLRWAWTGLDHACRTDDGAPFNHEASRVNWEEINKRINRAADSDVAYVKIGNPAVYAEPCSKPK